MNSSFSANECQAFSNNQYNHSGMGQQQFSIDPSMAQYEMQQSAQMICSQPQQYQQNWQQPLQDNISSQNAYFKSFPYQYTYTGQPTPLPQRHIQMHEAGQTQWNQLSQGNNGIMNHNNVARSQSVQPERAHQYTYIAQSQQPWFQPCNSVQYPANTSSFVMQQESQSLMAQPVQQLVSETQNSDQYRQQQYQQAAIFENFNQAQYIRDAQSAPPATQYQQQVSQPPQQPVGQQQATPIQDLQILKQVQQVSLQSQYPNLLKQLQQAPQVQKQVKSSINGQFKKADDFNFVKPSLPAIRANQTKKSKNTRKKSANSEVVAVEQKEDNPVQTPDTKNDIGILHEFFIFTPAMSKLAKTAEKFVLDMEKKKKMYNQSFPAMPREQFQQVCKDQSGGPIRICTKTPQGYVQYVEANVPGTPSPDSTGSVSPVGINTQTQTATQDNRSLVTYFENSLTL